MATLKKVEVIVTDRQYLRFLFATYRCKKCGWVDDRLIRHSAGGVYIMCPVCATRTQAYPSLDLSIDEWNGCKDPVLSKNEGE